MSETKKKQKIGKGFGEGSAVRHREKNDAIKGIKNSRIRMLARRGGIKRINGLIYEEIRVILKAFLEHILQTAIKYKEHGRRKTFTLNDIVHALKFKGITLYL